MEELAIKEGWAFLELFYDKFGSTTNYFKAIGLNNEEIENLRRKLV